MEPSGLLKDKLIRTLISLKLSGCIHSKPSTMGERAFNVVCHYYSRQENEKIYRPVAKPARWQEHIVSEAESSNNPGRLLPLNVSGKAPAEVWKISIPHAPEFFHRSFFQNQMVNELDSQ